jgi:hypothetical protein
LILDKFELENVLVIKLIHITCSRVFISIFFTKEK